MGHAVCMVCTVFFNTPCFADKTLRLKTLRILDFKTMSVAECSDINTAVPAAALLRMQAVHEVTAMP